MDIHVDEGGIDLQVNDADGVAAGLQDAAVRLCDRAEQGAIAYRAAVHQERQRGSRGTGSLGSREERFDTKRSALAAASRERLVSERRDHPLLSIFDPQPFANHTTLD